MRKVQQSFMILFMLMHQKTNVFVGYFEFQKEKKVIKQLLQIYL